MASTSETTFGAKLRNAQDLVTYITGFVGYVPPRTQETVASMITTEEMYTFTKGFLQTHDITFIYIPDKQIIIGTQDDDEVIDSKSIRIMDGIELSFISYYQDFRFMYANLVIETPSRYISTPIKAIKRILNMDDLENVLFGIITKYNEGKQKEIIDAYLHREVKSFTKALFNEDMTTILEHIPPAYKMNLSKIEFKKFLVDCLRDAFDDNIHIPLK